MGLTTIPPFSVFLFVYVYIHMYTDTEVRRLFCVDKRKINCKTLGFIISTLAWSSVYECKRATARELINVRDDPYQKQLLVLFFSEKLGKYTASFECMRKNLMIFFFWLVESLCNWILLMIDFKFF